MASCSAYTQSHTELMTASLELHKIYHSSVTCSPSEMYLLQLKYFAIKTVHIVKNQKPASNSNQAQSLASCIDFKLHYCNQMPLEKV